MVKLFYIPSHSLQQRTDKIPASGKSFKKATNNSNSWNAQQEELRRTLEMQSKALGASEYCNIHACMHTYIPEQPYERLCRQHG